MRKKRETVPVGGVELSDKELEQVTAGKGNSIPIGITLRAFRMLWERETGENSSSAEELKGRIIGRDGRN